MDRSSALVTGATGTVGRYVGTRGGGGRRGNAYPILRRSPTNRREAQKQREVLKERRRKYTPDRGAISPAGRTVIVVDDGVATGATMRAALETTRDADPDQLIVAVAVAPADTLEALRERADEVVCLEVPDQFVAVGQAFAEFESVTDEDAISALQSVREER